MAELVTALKKELFTTRTALNDKEKNIDSLTTKIQPGESRLRQSKENQEELIGQFQNAQTLYEDESKNCKGDIKNVNKK